MNILMIIGIILGGGVSVASTVGITVGIFGTIVWLDRAKSDSQDNNTDAQSKN